MCFCIHWKYQITYYLIIFFSMFYYLKLFKFILNSFQYETFKNLNFIRTERSVSYLDKCFWFEGQSSVVVNLPGLPLETAHWALLFETKFKSIFRCQLLQILYDNLIIHFLSFTNDIVKWMWVLLKFKRLDG